MDSLKHTVLPAAFFPSLHFFRMLLGEKEVCIETKEHFIKQTIRSRCEIPGPNGIQYLTVPVVRPSGSKTPMDEVLIDWKIDWKKQHLKTIESAYGSAPHFEYYFYELVSFYQHIPERLLDLNLSSMRLVMSWLDTDHEFNLTESYLDPKLVETDFRTDSIPIDEEASYPQVLFGNDFYPHASVIDLVMNMGPLGRNFIHN